MIQFYYFMKVLLDLYYKELDCTPHHMEFNWMGICGWLFPSANWFSLKWNHCSITWNQHVCLSKNMLKITHLQTPAKIILLIMWMRPCTETRLYHPTRWSGDLVKVTGRYWVRVAQERLMCQTLKESCVPAVDVFLII